MHRGTTQSALLSVTPWSAAGQALLSMGLSRQEYRSGWPLPPPGDLPDPRAEPLSVVSPALAGGFFTTWEARAEKGGPGGSWPPTKESRLLASRTEW